VVLHDEAPVTRVKDADPVRSQRDGQESPVAREGPVRDDVGEAANPRTHLAAGDVEQIDADRAIPRVPGPARDGGRAPVRRDGDGVQLTFVAIGNRRSEDAEQPPPGDVPDTRGLVVGRRHQLPPGRSDVDAPDRRRVHLRLDAELEERLRRRARRRRRAKPDKRHAKAAASETGDMTIEVSKRRAMSWQTHQRGFCASAVTYLTFRCS
jgi:hypothetical protein